MDYVFEIVDKTGRKIHLTKERLNHIKKHPHMNDPVEDIKHLLKNLLTIRQEDKTEVLYFYKEFKHMQQSERYLMVSVKYLNG